MTTNLFTVGKGYSHQPTIYPQCPTCRLVCCGCRVCGNVFQCETCDVECHEYSDSYLANDSETV